MAYTLEGSILEVCDCNVITTLNGSSFSTIPGSPVYVSKASRYRVRNAALELDIDLEGHNAIQGSFRFEG